MSDRVKTTVMLPRKVLLSAAELGRVFGVGRNGFIALALAREVIHLSRSVELPKKRQQLLDEIEVEVQKLIAEARKH